MCDMDMNIKELENSLQLTGLSGIRCGRVKAEIKQPRWHSDKSPTQRLHFIILAPFKPNQYHYRFGFQHMREKNRPTLTLARGVSLISQHTKTLRASYLTSHPPGCQRWQWDNRVRLFFPWCSACGICASSLSFAGGRADPGSASRPDEQPTRRLTCLIHHPQSDFKRSKNFNQLWTRTNCILQLRSAASRNLPKVETETSQRVYVTTAVSEAVAPGQVCEVMADENIDSDVDTRDANQASVTINHVWRGQKVAMERSIRSVKSAWCMWDGWHGVWRNDFVLVFCQKTNNHPGLVQRVTGPRTPTWIRAEEIQIAAATSEPCSEVTARLPQPMTF